MEYKKINITNRQVALAYCIITVCSSVLWGKVDKCSRQAGETRHYTNDPRHPDAHGNYPNCSEIANNETCNSRA